MKYKDRFYQNSMCLNSYLHRFNIELEYPDGVLEVCEICFKQKFFKVVNGMLDNANYMSWHLKQVLPLSHPFYERQYTNTLETLIKSPYYGK